MRVLMEGSLEEEESGPEEDEVGGESQRDWGGELGSARMVVVPGCCWGNCCCCCWMISDILGSRLTWYCFSEPELRLPWSLGDGESRKTAKGGKFGTK